MPDTPHNTQQPIAVFDFDDTLVNGDCFWKFLVYVAGWPKFIMACAEILGLFVWLHFLHHEDRSRIDRATFFKQELITRLLAGRRMEEFDEPAARLKQGLRWNQGMLLTLNEHYKCGHRVVIASGSIDLYLPALLKDLPHHDILCTTIEVRDGKATGVMSLGNCVRKGKAERVAAYLAEQGAFGESWGYGNFPDDVPMMDLLKHRIIV